MIWLFLFSYMSIIKHKFKQNRVQCFSNSLNLASARGWRVGCSQLTRSHVRTNLVSCNKRQVDMLFARGQLHLLQLDRCGHSTAAWM